MKTSIDPQLSVELQELYLENKDRSIAFQSLLKIHRYPIF